MDNKARWDRISLFWFRWNDWILDNFEVGLQLQERGDIKQLFSAGKKQIWLVSNSLSSWIQDVLIPTIAEGDS